MSLQTDLQTAVAKVTADGNLLHNIVHGDAISTVITESGPVHFAVYEFGCCAYVVQQTGQFS